MPSSTGILRAVYEHLLRLLPDDPAAAKRLDDIIDPDAGLDDDAGPGRGVGSAPPEPSSGLHAVPHAVSERVAS